MSVSDIISSRQKKKKSTHHFLPANPYFHPAKPLWQGGVQDGLVGLELELEGANLPARANNCFTASNGHHWRVERDGSLRNGLEYVLSGPIHLADVEPALTGLFNKLRDSDLVLSDRCSTHVHINCDTAKLNEVVSLFCLWALFEDIVIPWCGSTRTGNHFCTPLSVAPDPINIMQAACKDGQINPQAGGRNLRYTAVNLYAFPKFGSMEFRALRGAESPDMVFKWVKYLARLKELSTTTFANPRLIANYMSESSPSDFFRLLCEGNEGFYEDVVGVFNTVSSKTFRHTAFQNLYLIQPLLFDTDWPAFIEKSAEELPPENPFLKQGAPARNRVEAAPQWVQEIAAIRPVNGNDIERIDGFPVEGWAPPPPPPRLRGWAEVAPGLNPELQAELDAARARIQAAAIQDAQRFEEEQQRRDRMEQEDDDREFQELRAHFLDDDED